MPLRRTSVAGSAVLLTALLAGCGGTGETAAPGPTPTASPSQTPGTTPTPSSAPTPRTTPTTPRPDLSGLSANQLLTRTRSATLAATGFRVRGRLTDQTGDLQLDLQLTRTGGEGRFVVGGTPVTYRVVGKTIYMLMSEPMIRAIGKQDKSSAAEIDAMVKLFKGKWIKTSKLDQDARDMIELTSRDSFVRGFFDVSKPVKTARRVIGGVPVIGLRADGATLWVDTRDARPGPRRQGAAGGAGAGRQGDGPVKS